jgi:hypothetical protein
MAWNLFKFHIVDILPKQKIFNAMYHVKHILEPILALRLKSWQHHLIIHADNVRLYGARRS